MVNSVQASEWGSSWSAIIAKPEIYPDFSKKAKLSKQCFPWNCKAVFSYNFLNVCVFVYVKFNVGFQCQILFSCDPCNSRSGRAHPAQTLCVGGCVFICVWVWVCETKYWSKPAVTKSTSPLFTSLVRKYLMDEKHTGNNFGVFFSNF